MAFYRGQQGTVFFDKDSSGGKSEIAAVRSWSMTAEKESLDCTAQGASSRSYVGGLIGGSGSLECMYDAPGSGDKLDLLNEVNTSNDPADAFIELYLDESGGKKITGEILVTGADYGATVGELEVVTISFTFNGTITLGI